MKVTDNEILDAIRSYTSKNGYPPSFRDIGSMVGILSAGSVKYRLVRLREKGLVAFDDGKPRTLRVVGR